MTGFCHDAHFRNLVTVGADELKDLIINKDITASLLTCIKEVIICYLCHAMLELSISLQCCTALEQISVETGKDKQAASRKDEWNRILEHTLHSLSSMRY